MTALLLFTVGLVWLRWASSPAAPGGTAARVFVIQKGEGLSAVSLRLKEAGLVRSPLAFRLWVMAKGLTKNIQAGSFRVSPSLTPVELAESFTHGTLDLWLTFPEGWRREQISQRLAANLEAFEPSEFLAATADMEGRLFPDTYLFPVDADAARALNIITANFDLQWAVLESEVAKSGLSQPEILTLASIVEREVKTPTDRPLVAGILLKRWRADWPLQVDAAVQYTKATFESRLSSQASLENFDWWPTIGRADLRLESPYNTYLNKGLPPGPICNPGLSSIRAVLEPEASDYWFYLSDPDGLTHYAVTGEEHAGNVEKYLR